jgi:cell division protein FtsQ
VSPVAAPADRRFRRAHVKPARRKRNWRVGLARVAGWGAVALALAYGLHRGSGFAASAQLLRVEHINVRGNERLSKGEVLAVLSGLRGESLLGSDLNQWRTRLLSSPWVRDAALRRSLPSTVDVVVSERKPIGIGRIDGRLYLVDETGVLIDQYGPLYADLDLPIIDGLSTGSGSASADEARAALATRLIGSLKSRAPIAQRLSQIDVTELHNVSVILAGDPAIVELGDDHFLARLESYIALAPTLRERVADIDYVDLRFDERIYVRPAGKPVRAIDTKKR